MIKIYGTILIVYTVLCVLNFLCDRLYRRRGRFKKFYHDFLGWHIPKEGDYSWDGCSLHNVCKYCGKDIMQDSQGNWF